MHSEFASMMPSSRRVAPPHPAIRSAHRGASQPLLQAMVTALSRANTCMVAVGIASTFLLLSTILSFAPDRTRASAAVPALELRGTLSTSAD